jgi:hypothetical protein
VSKDVNSLTAMVTYLYVTTFFELRTSSISFRLFVRCQHLIARNVADGFLLISLADTFIRSSSHDVVSRGFLSGYEIR